MRHLAVPAELLVLARAVRLQPGLNLDVPGAPQLVKHVRVAARVLVKEGQVVRHAFPAIPLVAGLRHTPHTNIKEQQNKTPIHKPRVSVESEAAALSVGLANRADTL